MSLLIKALQKAEEDKKSEALSKNDTQTLSLESLEKSEPELIDEGEVKEPISPSEFNSNALHPYTSKQESEVEIKQKQLRVTAATMLNAGDNQESSKKGWILLAAFFSLAGFAGVEFYSYLTTLNQPQVLIARDEAIKNSANSAAAIKPIEAPSPENVNPIQVPSSSEIDTNSKKSTNPKEQPDIFANNASGSILESQPNKQSNEDKNKKASKSESLVLGEPVNFSPDASVQITKFAPSIQINPELNKAYQLFNAGDDAAAQNSYKQVLRNDNKNIDAMLGLAAIALRQNRMNDAIGWYNKILEIEPRNTIAEAALININSQLDPQATESRIKNLIAQQPESAQLYATLGNIYAEQGAWTQAQQAYFQAYHFDKNNPEYVFNLAISLDQLGKSNLALQFYKETLTLLDKANNKNIDRAQLEYRISQLN